MGLCCGDESVRYAISGKLVCSVTYLESAVLSCFETLRPFDTVAHQGFRSAGAVGRPWEDAVMSAGTLAPQLVHGPDLRGWDAVIRSRAAARVNALASRRDWLRRVRGEMRERRRHGLIARHRAKLAHLERAAASCHDSSPPGRPSSPVTETMPVSRSGATRISTSLVLATPTATGTPGTPAKPIVWLGAKARPVGTTATRPTCSRIAQSSVRRSLRTESLAPDHGWHILAVQRRCAVQPRCEPHQQERRNPIRGPRAAAMALWCWLLPGIPAFAIFGSVVAQDPGAVLVMFG